MMPSKRNGYTGHELEVYLVRLLFCLFVDDIGKLEKALSTTTCKHPSLMARTFPAGYAFLDFDTPDDKRMKNLPEELKRFSLSINGNLVQNAWHRRFSCKMPTLLECQRT